MVLRWAKRTNILLIAVCTIIGNSLLAQRKITSAEALNNIGSIVTICDNIVDAIYLENAPNKFTLLRMGGVYPNQKLTIVIDEKNRSNFPPRPEIFYLNKTICVTGRLELYRETPELEIFSPSDLARSADSVPGNPAPIITNVPSIEYMPEFDFEAGMSVGTMNGATDVGRKKSSIFLPSTVDWKSTKANISLYGGVTYKNLLGARLEMTFGRVAGADKNGLYPYRNLSYRSSMFEVAAIGEYYPLAKANFNPYVMAGVGVFSFKPQTYYNGAWIDLKPLLTEGQGFTEYPGRTGYKLTQLCLPFGAGAKYELSPAFNVRLEFLYRYTSTDYIDDASKSSIDPSLYEKYLSSENATIASDLTKRSRDYASGYLRGGTKTEDKYFTINVKFGYKLGNLGLRYVGKL
ncbi:MAG: outer membrane beta-barrel protein [Segetibacter sp.]|nr:outer membrane beta-barrel protein [Segetibacter sp.]